MPPDGPVATGRLTIRDETLGFVRDPSRDWEYEPSRWLWAFELGF